MKALVGEKEKDYDALCQVDLRKGMDPITKTENNPRNIFYCKYGK